MFPHLVSATRFSAVLSAAVLLYPADLRPAEPAPEYLQDEMTPRPAPEWVRMIEHTDPELKGLRTPAGIHVEIVAREPLVVDPVGMTFADDGSLYVLEWREATEQVDTTYEVHYQDGTTATVNRKTKNVPDELKLLVDTSGDGIWDTARIIMDDLEMPSSLLLHDGWMYLPSVGHVIRRRPGRAPGTWIEEEILRGLCGYHHHQASGLTISSDNWMYTTSGDDDNIVEGSDGSRATVLRTGAIFRSRPDGSQVSEYARGFRNPYRNVVFDERGNMFHVDNDQEDGSRFQGVRLMHILEGADYGWRLEMGAKCCRTDFSRGAVFGERPGKMPSLLKTGRGAPAGLLIYQGTAFPEVFRGLLIYPDVYRMKVRAYEIRRTGSTFEVVRQFTLMEADDGMFRPVQALTGPDGAIYILDWRTNSGGAGRSWGDGKHGRVYRLTWSGTDDVPAVPPGSMTAWQKIPSQSTPRLLAQLVQERDFDVRQRICRELTARGPASVAPLQSIARDRTVPVPARLAAFGAVWRLNSETAADLARELISDRDDDMRRIAAESLGHHVTPRTATAELASGLLACAERDPHPAVRRAAAVAAGSVAAAAPADSSVKQQVAASLLNTLRQTDPSDVFLFDGILRGIERCGRTGIRLLTELARSDRPQDREFATALFPALRTREAAEELDELLSGNTDSFSAEQIQRLLEAPRHILVRPPIDAAGVNRWLDQHRDADPNLLVTALETLGLVGGGRSDTVTALTLQLIRHDDPAIRLAAIRAAGELRVIRAAKSLYEAVHEPDRPLSERRAILQSLARLRAEQWPYADRGDPGVELILDDLKQSMKSWTEPQLVADAVWLIDQVTQNDAVPIALELLESKDTVILSAAVEVLGSDADHTIELAERLLQKQLPDSLRPQIAAALQRHSASDASGRCEKLLAELYRNGLTLSLDPAELGRLRRLVEETGDSRRGRAIFLRPEKSQCIRCHRIEGVGGIIGPDLNSIARTHTIEKIIESIVEPSREIKEGFETWMVVTTDGKVYGGLRISEGPPQFIIRTATGRDQRIDMDQIDEAFPTQRSLMPDETVSQLTLQEFVDLVAFLKDEQAQKELRRQQPNRP